MEYSDSIVKTILRFKPKTKFEKAVFNDKLKFHPEQELFMQEVE
jgi:hypothetical protein